MRLRAPARLIHVKRPEMERHERQRESEPHGYQTQVGDEFMQWFWKADAGELDPFVLVVAGREPVPSDERA